MLSPWTDLSLSGPSFEERAGDDPLLSKEMLGATGAIYLNGHDARDPLASPLWGELSGLPPIEMHVGTGEVLLDDTRRYVERARAARVTATAHVWDGMTHVFPAGVGTLDAAETALASLGVFLQGHFQKHS